VAALDEGTPQPTPTSSADKNDSTFTPSLLDDNARQLLNSLLMLPVKAKERKKIKEQLCPARKKVSSGEEADIKAALAITESDLSVEVTFDKSDRGKATTAPGFSVYIEFSKREVMIRPSLPRYATDAAGLWVPFPPDFTRFLWLEGKQGSDLLYLIPDVEECGVQAIVICPRTYVPRSTLALTGYTPVSRRYFGSAKADGLFAVGPGEKGKIRASILSAGGLELPDRWFSEDEANTPSAAIKYYTPRGEKDPLPRFISSDLPMLGSIEARLQFEKSSEHQRITRNRSTIEISQFDLPPGEKMTLRGAQLNIDPGACYLVARWREEEL